MSGPLLITDTKAPWEVLRVKAYEDQLLADALADGWEPFAVTTRDFELSEIIWLRRQ